ncbi:MAG: response regulator [Fuerstiella sp.]
MQNFNVLLIEDDDVDAEQVRRAFRGNAYTAFTVDRVTTIAGACSRIFQSDYDVILVDLGLPDCTGLDGVKTLISLLDIPIIVLTGNEDLDIADQAISLGAQDFILKSEHVAPVLTRAVLYGIQRYRANDTLNRTRELLNAQCSIAKLNNASLSDRLEVADTLAAFAENTQQCVAIVNADYGITWANNAFFRWFGLQQMPRNVSMASRLSLLDLSTTATDNAWIEQVRRAIANRSELHCHLLTEDAGQGQKTFRLELNLIPERDGASEAFALAFSEDLHSRVATMA